MPYGDLSAAQIRTLADDYEHLQRVAEAADRFMRNINGFHLIDDATGQVRDVWMDDIPEARQLKQALKDLQAI